MNTTQYAKQYDQVGFKLCVIHPGTKAPQYPRWEQDPIAPHLIPTNKGLGLLHVQSRTAAIDLDDLEQASHWFDAKGIDLKALLDDDDAVQVVSGKPNRAKLLYRLPEECAPLGTKKVKDSSGRILIELRCASSEGKSLQDVLPPTIHPETKRPYQWGGKGDYTRLPVLPDKVKKLWQTFNDMPLASAFSSRTPSVNQTRPSLALHWVDTISEGGRNEWLYKRAGDMVRKGKSLYDLKVALQELNTQTCNPPLDRVEVAAIAISAMSTSHGARELAQAKSEPDDWPEPTPLPNALPGVAAFNEKLLPEALRSWVTDIANRMQCPPDFPAVGALAGISSLIGARAVIQPKERDDWQVVPNLWALVVGRPGVKKSPALSEVLKPINELAGTEAERFAIESSAWEAERQINDMAKAAREKKAKGLFAKDKDAARALLAEESDSSPEPKARRFIVNDATVEKLGELLVDNPWGVLSFRDELYGLLTSLDKQGHEGSRSFYLTGFDGNQAYIFDRIMRGTVRIPNVCIALLGGIQPGRVQEYVRGAVAGGGADDGLLQRFGLAVWPDISPVYKHIDQHPNLAARSEAWRVYKRLAALQPETPSSPFVWRFTPKAQLLFNAWIEQLETDIRSDSLHPAMVSHLAKYRKLIPALALLFAHVDTPDSKKLVDAPELHRAISWGAYLRTHAGRLYATASIPTTADATTLLAKIQAGRLVDGNGVMLERFTPRLVASKGWSGLSSPEAVRAAADLLADYGYLRPDLVRPGHAGGRPSEQYLVNPRCFGNT
jgi:hypothetical protein